MSRKIALFGLGPVLTADTRSDETVVAVGVLVKDKSPPANVEINHQKVPVLSIKQLVKLEFDFVIITDTSQFNNIYITCAKAQIPQFKIISDIEFIKCQ